MLAEPDLIDLSLDELEHLPETKLESTPVTLSMPPAVSEHGLVSPTGALKEHGVEVPGTFESIEAWEARIREASREEQAHLENIGEECSNCEKHQASPPPGPALSPIQSPCSKPRPLENREERIKLHELCGSLNLPYQYERAQVQSEREDKDSFRFKLRLLNEIIEVPESYPSKNKAKDAVAQRGYELIKRVFHSAASSVPSQRSKGTDQFRASEDSETSNGEVSLDSNGNLKDRSENWIGILNQFTQTNQLSRPTYTEHEVSNHLGHQFYCECILLGLRKEPFGCHSGTFPTKKAAKTFAAREACLWLRDQRRISPDFKILKRKASGSPPMLGSPSPPSRAHVTLSRGLAAPRHAPKFPQASRNEIQPTPIALSGSPHQSPATTPYQPPTCSPPTTIPIADIPTLPTSPPMTNSPPFLFPQVLQIPQTMTPTQALPLYCRALKLPTPQYDIKAASSASFSLFSGCVFLPADPRFPRPLGEVDNVYGRANAKEECARQAVRILVGEMRKREAEVEAERKMWMS
ncbi:MAG: hypothetical protein Q9165_005860 [Trypethelium subeluteriae]